MIKICKVEVLENPCNFLQPFQFKITFIAGENLNTNEYEFKIVYVGSAESKDFDQILLSEPLGSYCKGQHDLILCSAPVDPEKIPKEELVAPSIVLLVGYHNQKQFFQVGYLVVKEYLDDEEPATITKYDKLQRRILEDFARIISDDEEPDSICDPMQNIESESLKVINSIIQQLGSSLLVSN